MKTKVISVFLALALLFVAVSSSLAQSPSPRGTARASEAKMRACEARESSIKEKMQSLVRYANNMFEKFSKIADRVQEFYTTKVLASGKTVANYETLVADVQAKKDVAAEALAGAQTTAGTFDCSVDNPRSLYTQFRTNMQALKQALKNYRTSIKNLILAVHRVNAAGRATGTPGATTSPEATSTPVSTSTPEGGSQ